MRLIRLADHLGRDAVLLLVAPKKPKPRQRLDRMGHPVKMVRRIKATADYHPDQLLQKHRDPDQLGRLLIQNDPEIDWDHVGRISGVCDRVYLNEADRASYFPLQTEPTASPHLREPATALWSNHFISRKEAGRTLLFSRALLIQHRNRLEFDFLLQIGRRLDERDAHVQVGGGPLGREPLILERAGKPYQAFLDVRVLANDQLRAVLLLAPMLLQAKQ